jgi:hypothetical protein
MNVRRSGATEQASGNGPLRDDVLQLAVALQSCGATGRGDTRPEALQTIKL